MNVKIENQVVKVKTLGDKMIEYLEKLRVAKERALNAKEEETKVYNEVQEIERELGEEQKKLFEIIGSEKLGG